MRVALISGSHRRHSFIGRMLAEPGLLAGWVIEHVGPERPQAPEGCAPRVRELFDLHFDRRLAAEMRFFSDVWRPPGGTVPLHSITPGQLNDEATADFLESVAPDLVVSYGCTKIAAQLMERVGVPFWNCHGGLSPWYRGVATHFWPSYMLEPQMTGVTLHETSAHLDAGGIIHQTAAPLVRGDGVHDIACRAVHGFASSLPDVLKQLLKGGDVPAGRVQKSTGRLWRYSDWRPDHLFYIYDYLQDSVVDRVLDGDFAGREPMLISVLRDA